MPTVGSLLIFVFFAEEFILWIPGQVSTITEHIVNALAGSTATSPEASAFPTLVNPAWCSLLFLFSMGPIAGWIRSRLPYDVLLSVRRYGWAVAGIVFVIILYQIHQILSRPGADATFLQVYQTKSLWAWAFIGVGIIRIVTGDSSTAAKERY